MEPSKAGASYSRSAVRRILKIRENRLRSWERRGLCKPQSQFGFADLVTLRALQRLRESRIPPERIEDALLSLTKKLPGVEHPLQELKIVSLGRQVAVELPNGRMDALTGQMLLDFDDVPPKLVRPIPERKGKLTPEQVRQAELWFRRGLELEESGAPPQAAIEAYRRTLELNPNAAGAWVNIGTLCYRQGDHEQAEHSYRQALLCSADYPLAHFNLGNICEELGRLDEAVNHYEVALQLHPAYADAHYNLALLHERLKEPMLAARHWRNYLNLDSTSPWAGVARRQLSSLLTVTPGGRKPEEKK